MVLFVGMHDFALDEKNRLSIPSKFREEMERNGAGKRLYVVPGRPPTTLWLYAEPEFKELAATIQRRLVDEDEILAFKQQHYGNAEPLDIDSAGRVVIPARHLKNARLSREVTLRGAGDHIEVISRADLDEKRKEDEWNSYPETQRRFLAMQRRSEGGNPAKAGEA